MPRWWQGATTRTRERSVLEGLAGTADAQIMLTNRESRLRVICGVLLAVNMGALAVLHRFHGGAGYDSLYGWVANFTMLVPTAACFALAWMGGPRRAAAIWLGLAMISQTAGNVITSAWVQFQASPPVPSAADFAYFGFYVCVTAAIVRLVRRDHGSVPRALWLDGALGAAGAATALAAALSPVFAATQGNLATVLVGATYTAADLLVVAMIGGLLAVRGLRGGSMWVWMAGGLALFCAADVAYALQINAGTYEVGSWLFLWWTAGVTCVAFAIWRPQRPHAIESGRSKTILAIPMLATLTAVVVLVISSSSQLPAPVVALATFTLLLAAARTFASFRQVQRLFDARRQAVTDELTGLGNRRFLFESGKQRLLAAEATHRPALILIDLDNFKEINDTFGHHAGDELLRELARRLAARMVDPDLLVRLGGDEFALLLTLGPDDDGRLIATRILDRLTQPLVVEGARVHVDASAGVAEHARHGRGDRRPAAARGRRDVRGQGRPLPCRDVPAAVRRGEPHPARDDPGPRRRPREPPVRPALPAEDRRRRPAPSSAPRRSCAGSTPRAGSSTPTPSCRSSSRAAS